MHATLIPPVEAPGSLTFGHSGFPRDRFGREHDLRRQHHVWQREGYDGHNRHGGLTTMDRLRLRRRRRLIHRAIRIWLRAYR